MGTTSDPLDPGLNVEGIGGQNKSYLVLSDHEMAQGFVRPLRMSYLHVGEGGSEAALAAPGCGAETTINQPIAATYATEPGFYGATFCVGCREHLPLDQFIWTKDGERVGS